MVILLISITYRCNTSRGCTEFCTSNDLLPHSSLTWTQLSRMGMTLMINSRTTTLQGCNRRDVTARMITSQVNWIVVLYMYYNYKWKSPHRLNSGTILTYSVMASRQSPLFVTTITRIFCHYTRYDIGHSSIHYWITS